MDRPHLQFRFRLHLSLWPLSLSLSARRGAVIMAKWNPAEQQRVLQMRLSLSSFAPQTDLIGCKAEGIFILAHREEEGLTRETRDILGRITLAVG